jgi:DNA-binding response OmpR family regulator
VRQDPYDALILDIGLAGIDGFETLRRVRAQGSHLPVLLLTARDAVEDRVRGLEGGADDYLVKPFALSELVARIRALVRRSQARSSNQIELAQLRLDLEARRAFVADEPLPLSAREWSVLGFLVARAGKVVGKEQLAGASQGWEQGVSDNAIEVCVSRLRAKIEPAGLQLRTVRGLGYVLEEAGRTDD